MQSRRFTSFTLAALVLFAGTASLLTPAAAKSPFAGVPEVEARVPLRTNDVGDSRYGLDRHVRP